MGEVRRAHQLDQVRLMRVLRMAIAHVEESLAERADDRTLVRALAHLWSAHDELELLAEERPPPTLPRAARAGERNDRSPRS